MKNNLKVLEKGVLEKILELTFSISGNLEINDLIDNFLGVFNAQFNCDYCDLYLFESSNSEVLSNFFSLKNSSIAKVNKTSFDYFFSNDSYFQELGEGTIEKLFGLNYNIKSNQILIKLKSAGFLVCAFDQNTSKFDFELYNKVFDIFSNSLSSCLRFNNSKNDNEVLQESNLYLKKLSTVAQYSDSSIVITNDLGEIEWVNDSFSVLSGYKFEEVLGKKPGSFLQGKETSSLTKSEMQQALNSKSAFKGEILNYSKSGKAYWIELLIQPIFNDNGELINFVSIQSEISKRKQIEFEKETAISQTKEAARVKQEFMKIVSHELRTPLNAIIGVTDLFTKLTLSIQQSEYLEAIKISAKNLQSVVNSILDFSTIESGNLKLQNVPFKLKNIGENILSSNESIAKQKKLNIEFNFDTRINDSIIGDSVRLSQIILNLMSNAIKFTHQGSIKLEMLLVSKMANAYVVEFKVSDTGCGIPEEKKKLIFESFSQADSNTNRTYEGAGLGLSISSKLVKLMGGDLKIDSEINKGSTFSFTLGFPIYKALEKSIEKANQSVDILKDKRILLVEDNPMNQFFTKKILNNWGVKVEIAENGKIGVEMVEDNYFDLVLMDIQMPVMDGFEATKLIKAKNSELPIIALTAMSIQTEIDDFNTSGFNDYLPKPFLPEDLQLKIMKNINEPKDIKFTSNAVSIIENKLYSLDMVSTMMKGDVQKIAEMEQLFKNQSEILINSLGTALKENNFKSVSLELNKFKASANLFQLNEIKEPIRILEKLEINDINKSQFEFNINKVIEILKKL